MKNNAKQQDLFDSSMDGRYEVKKDEELRKKVSAFKAAETRRKNKEQKEKENLRKFEEAHPESYAFF